VVIVTLVLAMLSVLGVLAVIGVRKYLSGAKLSEAAPQQYQYRYEATATSFLAGGRGDLDGDGVLSNFTARGEVRDGRLMLSPSIEEIDPEE
jgi:type II secretory pathway pseudopilin PulG